MGKIHEPSNGILYHKSKQLHNRRNGDNPRRGIQIYGMEYHRYIGYSKQQNYRNNREINACTLLQSSKRNTITSKRIDQYRTIPANKRNKRSYNR